MLVASLPGGPSQPSRWPPAVMARTALEPWDAHVAAIADASVCPILTLDAAKWRQHSEDLDDRLYIDAH